MSESSADRNPLDRLAEEFVHRLRAGKRPSLTEYTQRHPELAESIRELFPALVEMEHLKPVTADDAGGRAPVIEPSDPVHVGEFRILRRVGRGGMGVVYEAIQESLGRYVALKLLPADAITDPKRLERFRREASAAARLHHTNIVPVFGVGEAEGRHYYAMQFISGHPLDAVIDEVKRLKGHSTEQTLAPREVSEVAAALLSGVFTRLASPVEPDGRSAGDTTRTYRGKSAPASATSAAPAEIPPALSGSISEGGRNYWATVARIGAQIADALAYAHAQGVLHRDIKPANLLLDLGGNVWVTDFGLAKAADAAGADDLTRTGDFVGTLRYMAPERLDGSGDHRADVYALGLTLYELLTLEPAFSARGRAQLVEQVQAAAPPAPRRLVPAIPRDLETIVLKGIARDPAMRYPSAGALADDLRRFLEDRPIRARRASSAEQAFRWCRRNPAVASLLTAVLIVFAAGAAVAGFFAVRAEAEQKRAKDREQDAIKARNDADAEAAKVRAEKELTRRLLYISQMNHASVALNEGRITRVLEILEETTPKPGEPDLRGWEWHYLDRLLHGEYRTVTLEGNDAGRSVLRQGGSLNADFDFPFPLSGNGRRVVGSHKDGEGLRYDVWDTMTGRLVNQFPPPGQTALAPSTGQPDYMGPLSLYSAIFSLDGSQLGVWRPSESKAPEDSPGQLRIWNVDMGQELPAPDMSSSRVVTNTGGRTGRPLISIVSEGVRWLELSSPPARGSGSGKGPPPQEPKKNDNKVEPVQPPEYIARYWDRASGRVTDQRFRPGDGTDFAHAGFAGKSQDGRIILVRLYRPDTFSPQFDSKLGVTLPLECWDVAATPPRRVWTASALARTADPVRISPGGKIVAVADDSGVNVYRTEDRAGEPVVEWRSVLPENSKGSLRVLSAVFDDGRLVYNRPDGVALISPDRQFLLGPNRDDDRAATRQTVLYTAPAVQMTEDGKALVGVGSGCVQVWNLERTPTDRKEIQAWSLEGPLNRRSGRRVGRWFVQHQAYDRELIVHDALTGQVTCTVSTPEGTTIGAYQFDPPEDRLAVTIVPTRLENRPRGSKSPRNDVLRPAAGPFELRLLNPATGETIWKRPALDENSDKGNGGFPVHPPLFHILFTPSGRLLVGFRDAAQAFWVWVGLTATGEPEWTLTSAPEPNSNSRYLGSVRRMTLDRDGRRVAVIGGGEVRVWDLETGTLVATLRGHDSHLGSVALSPDGTRLFALDAGASMAARIRVRVSVWDLETARLVFTVQPPDAILLNRTDLLQSMGTMVAPGGIHFRDGRLMVWQFPAHCTFDGTPVKP